MWWHTASSLFVYERCLKERCYSGTFVKAVLKLPQISKDNDPTGHYIKSLKISYLQKVPVKVFYSNTQSRDEIF